MIGSMTANTATVPTYQSPSSAFGTVANGSLSRRDRTRLLNGEILIQSEPHTHWGAAATARMFLPCRQSSVWRQITDYPQWVSFFPDITRSEVMSDRPETGWKRIYQAASKNFLVFQAQVEIHLKVFEQVLTDARHQIQFRMEQGTFENFSADLHLEDYRGGTVLTYHVQATPNIPVPSMLIQQAIRLDLPANLEQMRRVLLQGEAIASPSA